ncbi:hypothetical protein WN55_09883 [Dufourea novaeangliae]|uniref:Uncharacterized protein n=1 Tax=Dufourea novaeangliae TaxID=178035 RepID=A0A154P7F7_DUFNO|nr:hypothetical protein WN55_09883 [Dufourea novaeangliae]
MSSSRVARVTHCGEPDTLSAGQAHTVKERFFTTANNYSRYVHTFGDVHAVPLVPSCLDRLIIPLAVCTHVIRGSWLRLLHTLVRPRENKQHE